MESKKPAADRYPTAGWPRPGAGTSSVTHRDVAPNRALVAAALKQLSLEHRALLRRAYYDGWSTEQIAVDLDIAEGNVKTQLHYALGTLQRTLRDMGTVP